jgi:uncharacterized membrane protein YbhN (UPF0104 family)
MDSLRALGDALEAFWGRLAAVRADWLALALGFHLLNFLLRTWAWRNIVAAAYPAATVRWRHTFGAYLAGVAVNGVVPARGGDAVKLLLLHRRVEGATYPTLASTLVAETLVDAVVASAFILWAWRAGLLPLPELPTLPAFEVSWLADNPLVLAAGVVVLVAVVLVVQGRVRAFWARVRQGLVILTTPLRYLRLVAVPQLLGWGCRLAGAWCFLAAFHVPPTPSATVLVQVASSVATSMPATPGGLGPKQALLVVVLGDAAARADVLAFSVGMELSILIFNVVLGVVCMALMLGGLRFRRAIREARRRADAPGGADPPAAPPA